MIAFTVSDEDKAKSALTGGKTAILADQLKICRCSCQPGTTCLFLFQSKPWQDHQ